MRDRLTALDRRVLPAPRSRGLPPVWQEDDGPVWPVAMTRRERLGVWIGSSLFAGGGVVDAVLDTQRLGLALVTTGLVACLLAVIRVRSSRGLPKPELRLLPPDVPVVKRSPRLWVLYATAAVIYFAFFVSAHLGVAAVFLGAVTPYLTFTAEKRLSLIEVKNNGRVMRSKNKPSGPYFLPNSDSLPAESDPAPARITHAYANPAGS